MSYSLMGAQRGDIMFIPQTLHDFIDNPMGKGSTVIMNRLQVRSYLDAKYDMLIKKFGDFKYTIYTDGSSYYFHFIIPSESKRRNTYDVVVKFMNSPFPDEDFSGAKSVKDYYIQLFSNCPSFTFTYAYVYKEYDRGISILYNKFRDENLNNSPVTRNPGEIISYEKSTYYACKFLIHHKSILDKSHLKTFAINDMKRLIQAVRTTDTVMKEIEKENNRLRNGEGNKGYVNIRKKTIKGSVYDTKTNKTAGVDKNSAAKDALKRERKSNTHVVQPKSKVSGTIKPKPKINGSKTGRK